MILSIIDIRAEMVRSISLYAEKLPKAELNNACMIKVILKLYYRLK